MQEKFKIFFYLCFVRYVYYMSLEKYMARVINTGRGCWGWKGAIRSKTTGYGCIQVGGRKGKLIDAHRYSYTLFIGDIPKGYYVLHKCDNRICSNPFHLFAGTQQDNIKDMVAKGRQSRWAKHGTIYMAKKCKCDLCVAAQREYSQQRYWLKKMQDII